MPKWPSTFSIGREDMAKLRVTMWKLLATLQIKLPAVRLQFETYNHKAVLIDAE